MSWNNLVSGGSGTVLGVNCYYNRWLWSDWHTSYESVSNIVCGGRTAGDNPGYIVVKFRVDEIDATMYNYRVCINNIYLDLPDSTTNNQVNEIMYICEDPPDFSLSGDVDITPEEHLTCVIAKLGSSDTGLGVTVSGKTYYPHSPITSLRPIVGKTYYMYIHINLGEYEHSIHMCIREGLPLRCLAVGHEVTWEDVSTINDISLCGAYSGPTVEISCLAGASNELGIWAATAADGVYRCIGSIEQGHTSGSITLPGAGWGNTDVTYYIAATEGSLPRGQLDAPPPSTAQVTFSRYRTHIYVPVATTNNTISASSGSFAETIHYSGGHISSFVDEEYNVTTLGVTIEPTATATIYSTNWQESGPNIDGKVIYPIYNFTRKLIVHQGIDDTSKYDVSTLIYGKDELSPYDKVPEPSHACPIDTRYGWQCWIDSLGQQQSEYHSAFTAVESDVWEIWARYVYNRTITIYVQDGDAEDVETGQVFSGLHSIEYPTVRYFTAGVYDPFSIMLSTPPQERYHYQKDNASWIGYGADSVSETPLTWTEVWLAELTEVYVQWKLNTNIFYGVNGAWIPAIAKFGDLNEWKSAVIQIGDSNQWKLQ